MKYLMRFLVLFFIAFLAACGGGGGSSGANPNQSNLISTSGDVLTIPAGAFRQFTLSGGVPPYQATSSEPAIAVGNVIGNSLSIGAISGGKALVRIFDYKGSMVATEVTVGSSVPLYTTAPSPLKIGVNISRTFTIGGGAPPYTVEGGNSSVAVVTQTDATHWSGMGKVIGGSDQVKITDSSGAVVTVDLSTAAPELRISPSELTMPTGMEAEITVTGGQAPYMPTGNIPAAIQINPTVSSDGKFKIQGSLASALDVTFGDSAGQSVKVKVTINTATVSFRMSPSPTIVSESGYESLAFSIFGFYGDSGTGATSGNVCLYISDPTYFSLDSTRTQCSNFSASSRSFTLNTGSRGNRCVSADKEIKVRAVDSKQQVADGVITILNNGTGCNTNGQLSLSTSSISLDSGRKVDVLIQGGTGTYIASPTNGAIVSAFVTGDVLSVTGGSTGGQTSVLVTDVGSGQTATLAVTNGTLIGGISVAPTSVTISRGTSTSVQILGGSGTFTASTANSAIAVASVSGAVVTITGGDASGATSVLVIDGITGSSAPISVVNGTVALPLTVTPTLLFTTTDQKATAIVSGGAGRYGVSNVNTAFVKLATVDGNVLSVTGGETAGTVNVVVYDLADPTSNVVVTVNNKGLSTLTAAPSSLTSLPVNRTASILISGGSNSYSVSAADSTVATATISASTVTVLGKKNGSTVLTVTDLATGRTVDIGVTISSSLTVSTTAITMAVGGATPVIVNTGSGSYAAVSLNTGVATVAPISGSGPFTISGVTLGATTVEITDSIYGSKEVINVLVN